MRKYSLKLIHHFKIDSSEPSQGVFPPRIRSEFSPSSVRLLKTSTLRRLNVLQDGPHVVVALGTLPRKGDAGNCRGMWGKYQSGEMTVFS